MKVLLYLVEAAAALVLLTLLVRFATTRWIRRRARWRRRLRSIEGGRLQIEVAKAGVDEPVVVATLDPQAAAFDEELYAAEGRADELAASLNSGER